MIEAVNSGESTHKQIAGAENKKVLYWKKNERMGGMVPVWGVDNTIKTAKTDIEDKLSQATAGTPEEDSFEAAMAYAETDSSASPSADEEFGFGDLVDMVNPLHHLPLVGYLYREITGDEIKPIAKIIGDGVFGGMAGAAAGLVDTVIEYETGKSLTGNVLALVTDGQKPDYRSSVPDQPEKRLNEAIKNIEDSPHQNLPGSVLSFTDLGYGRREVTERVQAADGRTAGTMTRKYTQMTPPEIIREPITRMKLDPLPLMLLREKEG